MAMKWMIRRFSVLVMTGILLSGCGMAVGGGKGSDSAMDMRGAAQYSDEILDATIGAVKPNIQWAHDDTTTGTCDVTRRRTVMTVISEQRRGNFLGVIENFWKNSGYKIVSVNESKDSPAIFATTPNGFGVNLTIGDKGQAYLEVNTPCVRKSEVDAPSTPPNGPGYEGVEIPRPNVRSDFWSADTPLPAPSSGATA
ncbi:hypothetical protein [Streptomyces sp. NPDC088258]|uniref:hypothetical protein n=1 Tax=Streptomyces sp. NPDC088258 TaxID=3365849 RepID=UPI0038116E58